MTLTSPELSTPAPASPEQARLAYRCGVAAPTSGWAPGYTQANMVTLPREWAFDMLLFAQRNAQAVPLLDVTDAGAVTTVLAPGADLRTDLPRYRVWHDGELVDEPTEVTGLWREDLVTFLIGCSFSFEAALPSGAGSGRSTARAPAASAPGGVGCTRAWTSPLRSAHRFMPPAAAP